MFAVSPTLKQHAQAGGLQRSFLQILPVCFGGTLRETRDLCLAKAAVNKVFNSIFVFFASGSKTTSSFV